MGLPMSAGLRVQRSVADRREDRHDARSFLWRESGLKRVRKCGRVVVSSTGVTVKASGLALQGRVGGFAGLSTCGSVWVCPVCAAKVAARRSSEVQDALVGWGLGGGSVVMVTLTMRHRKGQALRDLWDGVAKAWNAATSGRSWNGLQRDYGCVLERVVKTGQHVGRVVVKPRIPWVRVVEVTHGVNGWHVHVHAILFLARELDESERWDVATRMFDPWRVALIGAGFSAPLARRGGIDVRAVAQAGDFEGAVGDYFAKGGTHDFRGAAMEATRGDLKMARRGGRTPWQILDDLRDWGAPEDARLWGEWEGASDGRRQIGWSLRDSLVFEEEQTDQEIVDDDGLKGADVAVITHAGWKRVIAMPGGPCELLRAVEFDDDGVNLFACLDYHGIEYCVAPPARPV